MKVLLISQHFELRGGSDVMVHHTKSMLEEAGHEVHLFAARVEGQADDGVHPSGDHFESPGLGGLHKFFYNREARSRLDALLARVQFDVAHLHIHYGTLTSSIIEPLRRRRIPTVQHLHEYRSFCTISIARRDGETCTSCSVGNYLPGILHRCNRGSLLRSAITCGEMYVADILGAKSWPQRFLAVSDFQRDMLVAQGMPAERTFTLHNPVDEVFFSVEMPHPTSTVLYFGRIEEYKGAFDLLEVARQMRATRFVVAGDGNDRMQFERTISEQSLDNVDYLGPIDKQRLLTELRRASAVLVPSRCNETFGLTAVEAMAAGVPAVVTAMGGLPEVIEDGKTGFVVAEGDLAAMIDRLRTLIDNDDLRSRMAEKARVRARSTFDANRYLSQLENHYRAATSSIFSNRREC